MKKVCLVGPFSIKGGVSVHLNRVVKFYSDFEFIKIDESPLSLNSTSDIFNIRTLNIIKYLNLIISSDIVHVHSTPLILRFFHGFVSKFLFKKTIITIHSLTLIKNKLSLHFLRIICFLFYDKVIYVSNSISNKVNVKGYVFPAFIPPNMDDEVDLPDELLSRLSHTNKFVISSNAYRLNIYNQVDLYGLDLLIECCFELNKQGYSNLLFIFVVGDPLFNNHLLEIYENRIVELALSNFFLIHKGDVSFVKLIQKSNLVIRATNTDGDALSVRESLFLGKPIICSDVVDRPSGVILFKNRKLFSLIDKVLFVFNEEKNLNSNMIPEKFVSNLDSVYYDF